MKTIITYELNTEEAQIALEEYLENHHNIKFPQTITTAMQVVIDNGIPIAVRFLWSKEEF